MAKVSSVADLLMDALDADAVIGLTERLDAEADHTAAGVRTGRLGRPTPDAGPDPRGGR